MLEQAVLFCGDPDTKRSKENRGLLLPACFYSLLVDASTMLLLLPSFAAIRTQLFSLPTWTEYQWFSRNVPGPQCQIGTAEASSLMH